MSLVVSSVGGLCEKLIAIVARHTRVPQKEQSGENRAERAGLNLSCMNKIGERERERKREERKKQEKGKKKWRNEENRGRA